MKRALLNINVLIALLDANHLFHSNALHWFQQHGKNGWASCPITQNGCLRILSNPNYPNAHPVHIVRERLAEACAGPLHEFWSDNISLLENSRFNFEKIHGSKQLTDLYLLALAVHNEGRFVTFDGAITSEAISGLHRTSLVVL